MKLRTTVWICLALAGCSDPREGARKFVSDFYTWYIYDEYRNGIGRYTSPMFKQTTDSTFALDKEAHFNKLRELGYFGENYFLEAGLKYDTCSARMRRNPRLSKKDKWEEIPGCESEFLNENWVGVNGEGIDTFHIVTARKKGERTYLVTVDILAGGSLHSTSDVTVYEREGRYFIEKIEITER